MKWRINDDSTKIFLNTTRTMDDIPRPLKLFLNYIETGQALDAYTRELDSAVAEVRTNEKWRKPIMTMEMLIRDRENAAKNEGREEGRKEGIKEGKREGIKEGIKEGEFKAVFNFVKKGRMTVEEAASDIGITVEQLLEGFKEYNLVL